MLHCRTDVNVVAAPHPASTRHHHHSSPHHASCRNIMRRANHSTRHVYRHVCRHVCRHVYRHVCGMCVGMRTNMCIEVGQPQHPKMNRSCTRLCHMYALFHARVHVYAHLHAYVCVHAFSHAGIHVHAYATHMPMNTRPHVSTHRHAQLQFPEKPKRPSPRRAINRRSAYRHVYKHVCRHIYRHLYRHVYRHVFRQRRHVHSTSAETYIWPVQFWILCSEKGMGGDWEGVVPGR